MSIAYIPGLADLVGGVASVVNGSVTVTLSAAAQPLQWTNTATGTIQQAANRGDKFIAAQGVYEIASIDSATQITLEQPYAGATNAQAAYKIRRCSMPDSTNAPALLSSLMQMGSDANPDPSRTIDDTTGRIKLQLKAFKACLSVAGYDANKQLLPLIDALSIDPVTGAVAFPSGAALPVSGMANRLINGGFKVWQRATSGVVANQAGGYFGPDRWWLGNNNLGVAANFSKAAPPPGMSGQSAINVQATGVAINGTFDFIQRIEAGMIADIDGKAAAINFDLLATTTAGVLKGQVFILGNSGVDTGDWSVGLLGGGLSFAIPVGAGSVSVPLSPAITTGFKNGVALFVRFTQTGAIGNPNITFGAASLVAGAVAQPDFRPYAWELALCQRYYQAGVMRVMASGAYIGGLLPMTGAMRATPSTGYSDLVGTPNKVTTANGNGVGVLAGIIASGISPTQVLCDAYLSAAPGAWASYNYTLNAEL